MPLLLILRQNMPISQFRAGFSHDTQYYYSQERSAVQGRGNDDAVDDHHVHVHDTRAAAAAAVLPAVPSSAATGAVRRTQGHAAGIRSGPEAQADVP